jgi:hypothetical protein
VTERRDGAPKAVRGPQHRAAETREGGVIDLGRQAGNRALAELLSHQPAKPATSSAGLRLRDSLHAARVPAQREFGLAVQRDFKDEYKLPNRLLRQGSRGGDVTMLQQLLGVDADGIFGPLTRAAVVQFQQGAGLAVDGIVGPLTWSTLVSSHGSKTVKQSGRLTLSGKDIKQAMPASDDKAAVPESADKLPSDTSKIPANDDKLA